jgi:hypothetical protein
MNRERAHNHGLDQPTMYCGRVDYPSRIADGWSVTQPSGVEAGTATIASRGAIDSNSKIPTVLRELSTALFRQLLN